MRSTLGKSSTVASSIGMLVALSTCIPIIGPQVVNSTGPDWKSGLEFQQDHAYCKLTSERFTNNLPLYAQCMLARGDAIQYDNGPVTYPPNFFSLYSQPTPAPAEPPAIAAPTEPGEQSAEATPTPIQPPPPPGISLTEQQKEQLMADAAVQFGKAYLRCLGAEHKARCIVPRWIIGMSPDAKMVLCSNPDVLQRFISDDDLRNTIVGLLECPSV